MITFTLISKINVDAEFSQNNIIFIYDVDDDDDGGDGDDSDDGDDGADGNVAHGDPDLA